MKFYRFLLRCIDGTFDIWFVSEMEYSPEDIKSIGDSAYVKWLDSEKPDMFATYLVRHNEQFGLIPFCPNVHYEFVEKDGASCSFMFAQ
jgi:hypothetical protein